MREARKVKDLAEAAPDQGSAVDLSVDPVPETVDLSLVRPLSPEEREDLFDTALLKELTENSFAPTGLRTVMGS